MKKEDFKLIGGVSMIANLTVGIFFSFFVVIGYMIWRLSLASVLIVAGFFLIYILTSIFNVISAKKIEKIKLDGDEAKTLLKACKKQSYMFYFPIIYAFTLTRIRKNMADWYLKKETENLKKDSEIIKAKIKVLKDLREDGYLTRYSFDKQNDMLEEALKRTLEKESNILKGKVKENLSNTNELDSWEKARIEGRELREDEKWE